MSCTEIIAVCSEIHTKHMHALYGQNVELWNIKLVVQLVTTWLYIKTMNLTRPSPSNWFMKEKNLPNFNCLFHFYALLLCCNWSMAKQLDFLSRQLQIAAIWQTEMFNYSHDEGARFSSCPVLVMNSQTQNFGRCSVRKYILDSHLVICDEYGCFNTGPTESLWTGTVLAQLYVAIVDKHKMLW